MYIHAFYASSVSKLILININNTWYYIYILNIKHKYQIVAAVYREIAKSGQDYCITAITFERTFRLRRRKL